MLGYFVYVYFKIIGKKSKKSKSFRFKARLLSKEKKIISFTLNKNCKTNYTNKINIKNIFPYNIE
jgi:hypothetical protein